MKGFSEEFLKELLRHTPIVSIIIGSVLLLVGAAGGVSSSAFSIPIKDLSWRVIVGVVGLVLIMPGAYAVWRGTQLPPEPKVEVRVLKTAAELYRYVGERIKQAHTRVDDLTWGPLTAELRSLADIQAFQDYIEAIGIACQKSTLSYREVMGFPPIERIHIRVDRAEKMLRKNLSGYHLRYYEYPAKGMPPLLSFMIIDSEEVIFALYRYPYAPIEEEMRLAVRNPLIVRLFEDYYNTIWQGAKVLKDGVSVKWEEFEALKRRLGLPTDSPDTSAITHQ